MALTAHRLIKKNSPLKSLFNRHALAALMLGATIGAGAGAASAQDAPAIIAPETAITLPGNFQHSPLLKDPSFIRDAQHLLALFTASENHATDTARLEEILAEITPVLTDPRPEMRILLLSQDFTPFLQNTAPIADRTIALLIKGTRDSEETARLYSAYLLGQAVELDPAYAPRVLPAFLELMTDPSPHVQPVMPNLMRNLITLDSAQAAPAIPSLLALLKHPDDDTADGASRVLYHILGNNPNVTAHLIPALENLADETTQIASARALNILYQYTKYEPSYAPRVFALLGKALATPGYAMRAWTMNAVYALSRTSVGNNDIGIELFASLLPLDDRVLAAEMAISILNMSNDIGHADHEMKAIRYLLHQGPELYKVAALSHLAGLATHSPAHAEDAFIILTNYIQRHQDRDSLLALYGVTEIGITYPAYADRAMTFLQNYVRHRDQDWRSHITDQIGALVRQHPHLQNEGFDSLQILLHDNVTGVRSNAIRALGRIAANDENFAARMMPVFIPLLGDPEPYINEITVKQLKNVAQNWNALQPAIMTELVALHSRATNSGVLQELIITFGAIGLMNQNNAVMVLPHIISRLDDIPGDAQLTAIGMLLDMTANYPVILPDVIAAITPLAGSPDPQTNRAATNALQQLQEIQRQRVDHDHILIRARLETDLPAALLDRAAAERILPDVLTLTTARDPISRRRAVEMTGQLARAYAPLIPPALDVLLPLAADNDAGVRLAVTQSLGMIGMNNAMAAERVLPALQILAADSDTIIAGLAVNAIGMFGNNHAPLRNEARRILEGFNNSSDIMTRTTVRNQLRSLQNSPAAPSP